MKLLANENIPLASVLHLKGKGYDISYIGYDNFGIKDFEVMNLAIEESRTIITFDRYYSELIFKHNFKPQKRVIYLRLIEFDALEPGIIIEKLLTSPDFSPDNALTVIDLKSIRQRKY